MTLDELKQLPSRERDALVAERVMGWTVYREWDKAQWGEPREEYSGPWFKLPNARREQWPCSLTEFADGYWIVPMMERMRAMRFVKDDDCEYVKFDGPLAVALKAHVDCWECGWEVQSIHGRHWAEVTRKNRDIRLHVTAFSAGEAVVLGALLGSYYMEQGA